jgi:hypothetical protein
MVDGKQQARFPQGLLDRSCILLTSTMNAVIQTRSEYVKLRFIDIVRNIIGWCLEKIGAPARLNVFEFVDPRSDETVYLYTSQRYSILCVGDRRFYFDRISGKFDGISSPEGSVPGGIEFRD